MDLWFPTRVIVRLDIEREITGGYGGTGYVPSTIPERCSCGWCAGSPKGA
jgi:hypothetical protein